MSKTILVTTRVEITRTYEIDVDKLTADPYFDDVNLQSEEAIGDQMDAWLMDEPDDWTAPWATEIRSLGDGAREVYEVVLNPAQRLSDDGHRLVPVAQERKDGDRS